MKKSITVTALTDRLYYGTVRPAMLAANLLEQAPAVAHDGREYTAEIVDEIVADAVAHMMYVACISAHVYRSEYTLAAETAEFIRVLHVHETDSDAETAAAVQAILTAVGADTMTDADPTGSMPDADAVNVKAHGKITAAIRTAVDALATGDPAALRVSVSQGNTKMGAVTSVSLLPFVTCPARCAGTCGKDCYAAKLCNLRPSVLASYARNTALALRMPALYWQQVRAAMAASRWFRFHVSGDIPSASYFGEMVQACRENPHCETLIFTKRYEIANAWMDRHGDLPDNLHILFSGWTNLRPVNPHNLPETTVYGRKETPADDWKLCGGNCIECGCRGVGCWQAQPGDTIAFKMH